MNDTNHYAMPPTVHGICQLKYVKKMCVSQTATHLLPVKLSWQINYWSLWHVASVMPDLPLPSPAAGHYRPLTGTKLILLETKAHMCKQLAQGCYMKAERHRTHTRDILRHKFNTITITPPGHEHSVLNNSVWRLTHSNAQIQIQYLRSNDKSLLAGTYTCNTRKLCSKDTAKDISTCTFI